MFYIKACFYIIVLSLLTPILTYADEKFDLSDNLTLKAGLSFSGALQATGDNFQFTNTPSQGSDNQPTSEIAHLPKYLSLHSRLKIKNLASVQMRVDYLWNIPLQLGLYQKSQVVHQFLLRDLYVTVPFTKQEFQAWAGVRTFEFTPVTLFGLPNPFDQISLQGGGIETENLQFTVGFNQGRVNTIGTTKTDIDQQLIVDENGHAVQYEGGNESIVTLFLSGKLLLTEGRLFEPIFAFRYYSGSKGRVNNDLNMYRVKQSSALIVGGIFSRPISNGIAGTTTVWFSSLPSDAPVSSTTLPINNTYNGAGRVAPNTPMNTIGIIDSSEFYFMKESGLLTAIYATNNTYSLSLPVLKVTGDKNNLEPDGLSTSNSNNRLSLGLEPLFFINKHLIGGIDFNLSYVSKKLFMSDTNSVIFSPLLKWAFDEKLNSIQYLFTSLSYGVYDWKVKKFSEGSQTNRLFSIQVGAKVDI